jgi:phosphoglycolate phosphatase
MGCFDSLLEGRALSRPATTERGPPEADCFPNIPSFPYSIIPMNYAKLPTFMKTALFDLDGTLIDSLEDIALGVNLTRQDFGLSPRPTAEILTYIGDGVGVLLQRAIPELAATYMPQIRERQKINYMAHLLDHTVLYPGIKEALVALKEAGWRLGVVTNKQAAVVPAILDGLGVLDLFDGIVGGGDSDKLKPDPYPLYQVAERMGVTLDSSDWMVGDHHADMEAAKNAHVKGCFCRWGIGTLENSSFTVAVDHPSELLSVLQPF